MVGTTSRNEPPLVGKVAIVTGASRKIGRAIALALAGQGAKVVVHARNSQDQIAGVAEEIRALGGEALPFLADVTDQASVKALVSGTLERFGGINILVNNAAIRDRTAFTAMSLARWREVTSVILDGAFLCARETAPYVLASRDGSIVNIGGITGHMGAGERAHVISAKAGLVGLTKALAVEFGPYNVNVNCVVPGDIGGARSATAGALPPLPGAANALLQRQGVPDEVAAMVLALCLPSGRYVTGQAIHVNGGMYLP